MTFLGVRPGSLADRSEFVFGIVVGSFVSGPFGLAGTMAWAFLRSTTDLFPGFVVGALFGGIVAFVALTKRFEKPQFYSVRKLWGSPVGTLLIIAFFWIYDALNHWL